MRKTSVYLSEMERQRLAWLAARSGRSQAQILREAVRSYLLRATPDRRFSMARVAEGDWSSVADLHQDDPIGPGRHR